MDALDTLPPANTQISPAESHVLNSYYGETMGTSTSNTSSTWISIIKLSGILSIGFIVFANPMIDKLFCKIPYCGNVYTSLVIKTILFFVFCILVVKFV